MKIYAAGYLQMDLMNCTKYRIEYEKAQMYIYFETRWSLSFTDWSQREKKNTHTCVYTKINNNKHMNIIYNNKHLIQSFEIHCMRWRESK